MKILFFSHYSSLYGANRSLLELVNNLNKKYNIKSIVVTPNYGEFNKELDKINIENKVIKFYWWMYPKNQNRLKILIKKIRMKIYNKIVVHKLNSIFKNEKIDIIHTNSSVINIGAMVADKFKLPHVWHIREFGEEDYGLRFYLDKEKVENYMSNKSKYIILISNAIREKYADIDDEKAKIIYNGVNIQKYYYSKLSNKNRKIIISGKISENKNQLEVIKAIHYIKNKYNYINLELYIVGEGDSNYINRLKEYINKNDINNVIFTGYTKNIMDIQKDMDIGVITSNKEAFGRVTVEYMLSGLAVIASKAGANEEIINSNEIGMLYELNNYKDLGEKLYKLCTNDKLLHSLSKRGQQYALSNFTSDINSKNIYNLYKNIIGGSMSE